MKYIGIVGSRRRHTLDDYNLVREAFYSVYEKGDVIVSGGCKRGADAFAEILAKETGTDPIIYFPDEAEIARLEETLPRKIAYAIEAYARNTLIALKSNVLIACVAGDRKGGTEDTIKKFDQRGKLILV